MKTVYLFDWGDTLMVDFPDQVGKMCKWDKVAAVEGASHVLEVLSRKSKIYVATNAADSSEKEIEAAFARVGLSSFISGYFCKANLGIGKDSPEFFLKIIDILDVPPEAITMVGDSYDNDIQPAIEVGIQPIWFSANPKSHDTCEGVQQIHNLSELCPAEIE